MTYIPKENNQKTAFGEMAVAEFTPQVQLQFAYNINSAQTISFPGNGGSITNGNTHVNVASGTSSDGFANFLSRDVVKYNSGQGALIRFTALFTTGVADSEQVIGCGNGLNGFFFGYNGADFGVLRRTGGMTEVRTLTVTTGSTTAEDVTVTLDGIAVTDVTVTNSGDATVTAREIAAHDYSGVGTGWAGQVVGNKVDFISLLPSIQTGAYSLSGATTAVGTFAQTIAGITPTDTWTNQTDWNHDKMDGTGPSGMTLDKTKGNVYQIRYQWLGYGAIKFCIEDAETGEFVDVHHIRHANTTTSPSVANPTFPLFVNALNKGNTSDLVIKSSSMSAFIEGRDMELGPTFSESNLFVIGNVTTEEPVLTVRNKQIYQSEINQVRMKLQDLDLTSNLATSNSNTTFRVYVGATAENGTSYTDVSTNSSVAQFDTAATDFDLSRASLVASFLFDQTQSRSIDISMFLEKLAPSRTLMITAQPSKGNANNEVGASLIWKELF